MKPKVLIVEDDTDVREGLTDLLEDAGYAVTACGGSLAALEYLQVGTPPDVICLDLRMEGMDGWEFRVRQRRNPKLSTIPVIVLSADASPKAEAIDADAYLRKPIDFPRLLQTIERVLLRAERRRLEALHKERDRLSAVGALAGGLAHEINNPLAVVSGNLHLLEDGWEQIASSADLDTCKRVAQAMRRPLSDSLTGLRRITDVVSSIYAFSRPEARGPGAVDVRQVLDLSVQLARAEIRPRAELVREDEDLPLIRAEATRLGQVFLNLLLNAAQAIPEGRANDNRVCVKTRSEEGQVIVEVSDTGSGIPADLLGRIYDPFFTTKPMGEGMGIGLSICHSAVHSMGGTIEVESVVGKGTTFRVRFPAIQERPAQRNTPLPSRTASPGRRRVLVIDDESLLCNLLTNILAKEHDVRAFTDARLAVEQIRSGERFDLILCDLMMPEMTGADVYSVLQKEVPEQAQRMVFLTGGAFTPASREFLESVPNPRILKPFKVAQILELAQGTEPAGPSA